MAFPVRRCALVGRLSDPRVAESVAALLPHLSARQVQVIVGDDAPLYLEQAAVGSDADALHRDRFDRDHGLNVPPARRAAD